MVQTTKENIPQEFRKTEVGVIPEDWSCSILKNKTISIASGKSDTSNEIGGKYPIYGSTGIIASKSKPDYKGERILVARVGANAGRISTVEGKYGVSDNTLMIQPTSEVEFKYLSYFLRSVNLNKLVFGSGQPLITGGQLKAIKIPLPPTLAEQTAIANALSDMDALIDAQDKLIHKKRLIKQGAMQELLRPKEGWVTKTLGEIGDFKNGINKSSTDFGFGYPFVNLMDVFGKTSISTAASLDLINSNTAERKLYNLKEGDVLFIRSSVKPSGVGLTCVIQKKLNNTVFSGFIIRFRDKGFFNTLYKKYCFHYEPFRNQLISNATISANTNINQDALKRLIITFPKTHEEQQQIAQILSDMDTEIEQLETQLTKYKQMKAGMMQELLTGKKRLNLDLKD